MRASTLFGIALALLLGLGVALTAKYSGFFEAKAVAEKKENPIQILVAKSNLFEGMTTTRNEVRVRPLREDEVAFYNRNKDKLLPALPESADFRILARSVASDEPLLKEHFQDQAIPDSVSQRLEPGMRAVNLSLPRDRTSGGLLRVGERVDVLLTTTITNGDGDNALLRTSTAPIARNLRIILKRNSIWTTLSPIPKDEPLAFTLEANPYRAALIELAKHKGELSLVPSSFQGAAKAPKGTFSDPESKEYRDEDTRVASFNRGELSIGDSDLERIFNLRPLSPRAQPVRVERYSGVNMSGFATFPGSNTWGTGGSRDGTVPASFEDDRGMGYQFSAPGDSSSKPGCKNCGKK